MSASDKKVLILGCGLVVPPLIQHLNHFGIHQTIATRTPSKADSILKTLEHPENCSVLAWDVEKKDSEIQLDELTKAADLVISLLPYVYHIKAAKIAIKHAVPFCTASYVSAEMEKLDQEAKDAGIILLNECGVDPGLDHMSAMKVIDSVHAKGGKVIGFRSLCGGLPSPDANDNPWGYKLSWSPRGVLLASKNSARYLEDGAIVDVDGEDLFAAKNVRKEMVDPIGKLEWYLNRDSVSYKEIYRIPECVSVLRGTYRYLGWCRLLKAISDLGLTSLETVDVGGIPLIEAAKKILRTENDPKSAIAEKLEISIDDEIITKLNWLGFFSKDLVVPDNLSTSLDVLCHLCQRKLVYKDNETDMIVMKHAFQVEYPGNRRETITSTLIDFGQQNIENGNSSMARTVTLPLAIAVRKILEGKIKLTGVQRPVVPELYNPILDEMEDVGVKFIEVIEPTQIWIRAEVKPGEERVPLTPDDVKAMVGAEYDVVVERSKTRCFRDEEYSASGATLVESGSWISSAPYSSIIFGLKELPDEPVLLKHRHIFFAHCFKKQRGWQKCMDRFTKSSGFLWDLEFLNDSKGRRVAAFGYPAGVNGSAVGILAWSAQQVGIKLESLSSWSSVELMLDDIKSALSDAVKVAGRKPRVHVMGALGRCGRGAVWIAEQCGLQVEKWDLAETAKGGPFEELLESDVLVNCIYLAAKIPPFLTSDLLSRERNLSVLVDVSCDLSNPFNPVPVYNDETTFVNPVLTVLPESDKQKIFQIVAIDHLPSLTPRESSQGFSRDLLPTLLQVQNIDSHPVWKGAEKKFYQVAAEARELLA